MSIALMTLAWKTDLSSGRKLVLLALCDNANDQGECYPSIKSIAVKCSMGERTVQQHIKDMEGEGVVVRLMRKGRSTVYQIDPRKFRTPAESAPPQNSHHTPAGSAPPPPQNSHHGPADSAPITITEPSVEPSGKQNKAQAPENSEPEFDPLRVLIDAGVPKQVAKDWLKVRKAKNAPLTLTAWQTVVEEAKLAGIEPAEAVRVAASNSWQGFKASWLPKAAPGTVPAGGKNKQEELEERNRAVAARLAGGSKK